MPHMQKIHINAAYVIAFFSIFLVQH